LLGLFFIAIGMNLDLQLLVDKPLTVAVATLLLVAIKAAIIFFILKLNKQSSTDSARVSIMLCQGGEFAFVVMTLAVSNQVIEPHVASMVNLVVGVSMALTSPLVIAYSCVFNSKNCPAVYDTHHDSQEPRVLIAGFGRFGQITARILTANGVPFTAMDKDAKHIEFVQQFGNKVFYGDATRLDLLRKAGIQGASIVFIAIDDMESVTKLSQLLRHEYPDIQIVARAHNRTHVTQLANLGVTHITREMFGGALEASKQVLLSMGYSQGQADYMAHVFAQHDDAMLQRSIEHNMTLPDMIESSKQGREELRALFANDQREIALNSNPHN
jgi:CPA2 family monovalent cation:H+ antiporter-2